MVDPIIEVVNSQVGVLILTGVMVLVAGIVAALFELTKPKPEESSEGEKLNPYLAGEPESVVTRVDAPIDALYWGFAKGWGKKLYNYLREVMHSGNLNDWCSYMSLWMGIGSLIALVGIVAYIIWGWSAW